METAVASRLGVSLPVVADFRGTLVRGVTQDLGFDSISFVADCAPPVGTQVSVLFYFSRNVAYLRLTGRISGATEELGDTQTRFRLDIRLSPPGETERRVWESALHELDRYLRSLDLPDGASRDAARTDLVAANPRSILSLFITDNPYDLPYRSSVSADHVPCLTPSETDPPARRPEQHPPDPVPAPPASAPTSAGMTMGLVWQGCGLFAQVFRDLVIRFLPDSLARLFVTPISFAFIGHPRTLDDVPRKFPFARFLPRHIVDRWFRYQWPFVASYITGLTTADGRPTTGAMLISPLTTEHMLRNPRLARQRVLETVRLAEKMGATIAGLGAFTSIVTKDGRDLDGKVRLGLTTGNPHSAAIAVQNVLHAAALTNLSLPHATAAVVGGAGSVGSACVKLLARLVANLLIVDIKKDALQNLLEQLADQPAVVEGTADLDRVRDADIVIAATNNPHILLTARHLKPGAIVIDAAQPKNVSEEIPRQRPDVIVIESAVVQTPDIEVNFDLDLAPGEALGCLSETMILTAIGWNGHYSLGKADPLQAAHIISAGRSLGFRLARFRNSCGYVTDDHLLRVSRIRAT